MAVRTLYPGPLEVLLAKADAIEYVDALTMYLGFYAPQDGDTDHGTAAVEGSSRMSICKVVSSGASMPYTQRILWANGANAFNLVWNNRATYTYTYKNWR